MQDREKRTEIPTLVTVYLRYGETQQEADSWAYSEVYERVSDNDPIDAWDVTIALVEGAASDDQLGYVGAGPLESLVTHHGTALLNRIEERARGDARFRACLGSVWLTAGVLPPETEARIVAASNGTIELMPPPDDDDDS
jgi:Family of unknown function (DUF6869)